MKQAVEDHPWMHCPTCDLLLPFDTDSEAASLHLRECARVKQLQLELRELHPEVDNFDEEC
jgi:hypothetical protein